MEKMGNKGMNLSEAKASMGGMQKMDMMKTMVNKDMPAIMRECEKMMAMMDAMMKKMKGMM